jgi:hypothetical protein
MTLANLNKNVTRGQLPDVHVAVLSRAQFVSHGERFRLD